MAQDEKVFDEVVQANLISNSGLKRPQYFNRVKMGFDWNNYNKVHFDEEKPPPKIVQGYKFNIFYPDLIDKTKAPEYQLHQEADDPNFLIIRFKASPPYEVTK